MKNKYTIILSILFFLFLTNVNAANERIVFLHHSTGGNVYSQGGVAAWFTNYNSANGTAFQITERAYPNTPYPWNNYPYDYWNLWINGSCNSASSGIECMSTITQNYEVIIYKHCFPGADVLADTGTPSVSSSRKSLENYKLQYRALRTLMDSYPSKIFIVWTLAPRHRLATNAGNASRAKQFVDWVKNDFLTEDGKSHSNIYIFDFWNIVAGADNFLKYEYEGSHTGSDSHPNTLANQTAGPLFGQFIVNSINVFNNDKEAPSVPLNLSGQAVSSSQINLSWNASSDNVAVTGYKIYRNGQLLTTVQNSQTSYSDNGLTASTSYTYTVSAIDAALNESGMSMPATVITKRIPVTYYVDKDNKFGKGSNNNWPGTMAQPKYDLSHAWFQSGLRPGDIVIVREASAYGEIRLYAASSGESGNSVTIKAYPGEKINVDGSIAVGGMGVRIVGDTSYVTIQDVKISNHEYSYAIEGQVNGNNGLKLTNSEIYNCQHGPRWFRVFNSEISDCYIHDLSVNGVQFRDAGNITVNRVNVTRVKDNRSPDNSDADGFHTYGGENIIIMNSESSFHDEDGFDLNANATLVNVRAHHNNGAGLKAWRRVNDNWADKTVTVINALVYNNGYYAPDSLQGNPGIKISDGAGFNIYNSVVYGNYDQGIKMRWANDDGSYLAGHPFLPTVIKNTIIAGTIDGPGLIDEYRRAYDTKNLQEPPTQTTVLHLTSGSNNLFYNNAGGNAVGYNLSNTLIPMLLDSPVTSDPKFVSALTGDFQVLSGSPAINTGANLSALGIESLLTDLAGISRPQGSGWDIGAYEYSSTTPSLSAPSIVSVKKNDN